MSSQMNARRYTGLIHLLVAVLLFSAVAPCGLIELAAASVCTGASPAVEHVPKNGPAADEPTGASAAGEEAGLACFDCCVGCLTCCASYTEALASGPLAPAGATKLPGFFMKQGPLGTLLSIWRPPRV